jgi:hypothetical protein
MDWKNKIIPNESEENMSKRFLFTVLIITILLSMAVSPVFAGDEPAVPVTDASGLVIPEEDVLVAPELQGATGSVQIVVGLIDSPLAQVVGVNAKQKGSALKPAEQRAYLKSLDLKQDVLLNQIAGLGGLALGRVNKALDAVMVEVDASQIEAIAALPNVASIRPVINYEVDLSETVPYIGAAAVQAAGVDGTGVRARFRD